jgi:phage terminase large subunit
MKLQIQTPAWAEPWFRPARYKGAYGGRGSGKSHFVAEYLVELSLMKRTDIVCIREIQKSLNQSVKKLIEAKIEALGVGHFFEIQEAKQKARGK